MDTLLVSDGSTMPVGKIICLGRNYLAHAVEMNSEPPKEPVLFLKPKTSIMQSGGTLHLPPDIGRVDHEVELAVHIGRRGRHIEVEDAMGHVFGYSTALDITARDIQAEAKKKGLPWSLAKGIDGFCPIGMIELKRDILEPHHLDISLKVNGEQRQSSNTSKMIFNIPDMITYISKWMTLELGDIILTGTPEGVSPILPGDRIVGKISSLEDVVVNVAENYY